MLERMISIIRKLHIVCLHL